MEELIEEVRKHPLLYNTRLEEYKDLQRKDNSWEEIAKNLNSRSISNKDWKHIKKDWKRLRDCFRQAVARRKTSGQAAKNWKPWRYEKQMQFLVPFMNSRETTSNIYDIHEDGLDDDDDSVATTGSDLQEDMATSVPSSKDENNRKKRKSTTISDVDKVIMYLNEKKTLSNRHDDLDFFFMSACQSTRELPRRLQNQIKKNLLDCIIKAEEQHEYEMSRSAHTPSPAPSTCSAATVHDDSNSSLGSVQGSGVPQNVMNDIHNEQT